MSTTPDTSGDPLSTKDPILSELYLNSVVSIPGFPFGVILLRIYEDAFMTSAGYTHCVHLPQEPVPVAEYEDILCYCAAAATELPTDFMNRKCIASCSLDLLYEADPAIIQALISGDDISIHMLKLVSVELDDAYEIAKSDKPQIMENEERSEYRVFVTEDGNHWSWVLLFPENYFN